jgi:hypothetical protein
MTPVEDIPVRYLYASSLDVEAHLSFVASFTPSTIPNASQVHRFLDDACNQLDAALASLDYSVPIATTATKSAELLRTYAGIGAAMWSAYAMPQGDNSLHGATLERQWTAILNGIKMGSITLPDATKSAALSGTRTASYDESSEPGAAAPYFKRGAVGDI